MTTTTQTSGFVAAGYELVAEEFERNFGERGELGAAFAAVRDGELVVDLWGGVADPESARPLEEDTLQLVFSGTKGLVAVCILLLIERGRLELDVPVARYWPEFAARGKHDVRVRDVVAHTARLPGIETPLTLDDLVDDQRMAALLAAQPQSEDPRARLCYHAKTYGWLCGELVRRVDGRSIGRFFAEEVAEPLGLELWIGLPEVFEPRVATLVLADEWLSAAPTAEQLADQLLRSIWRNPPTFERARFPWDRRDYHAAEIPSSNAIGTARSIARLYGSLERLLAPATIELGRITISHGRDEVHTVEQRFGVGFQLQTELRSLGPPAEAFGHPGAGGSIHGCWPAERVGFSYAMNLLRDDPGDMRGKSLLAALYRSLG